MAALHHDRFTGPFRVAKRLLQQLRRVAFRNDHTVEVETCAVTPILVRRPGVAVAAAMFAALVHVHAPRERQVRWIDLVQDGPRVLYQVAGGPPVLIHRLVDALPVQHPVLALQGAVLHLLRGTTTLDSVSVRQHVQEIGAACRSVTFQRMAMAIFADLFFTDHEARCPRSFPAGPFLWLLGP